MKITICKISVLFIIILMFVSLCGCGKNEAVTNVENQISNIGVVDETSSSKIEAAEKAYAMLTDKEKGKVANYQILQSAREEYGQVVVNKLEQLIDAIDYTEGEPTDEVKRIIKKAQKDYDNLSEDLQAKVTNYANLEKIIDSISAFYIQQAQNAIDLAMENNSGYEAAKDLYNALTEDQKAEITNYDEFTYSFDKFLSTPPVELISCRLGKDSLGDPKLYINAKNNSDKIVKEFSMVVFAFDNDGIPVKVYFNDYGKGITYGQAIKSGESTASNVYWQLYGDYKAMKQIVCLVKSVEYFDGTIWENPILGRLVFKYDQQILTADDEYILPRR